MCRRALCMYVALYVFVCCSVCACIVRCMYCRHQGRVRAVSSGGTWALYQLWTCALARWEQALHSPAEWTGSYSCIFSRSREQRWGKRGEARGGGDMWMRSVRRGMQDLVAQEKTPERTLERTLEDACVRVRLQCDDAAPTKSSGTMKRGGEGGRSTKRERERTGLPTSRPWCVFKG